MGAGREDPLTLTESTTNSYLLHSARRGRGEFSVGTARGACSASFRQAENPASMKKAHHRTFNKGAAMGSGTIPVKRPAVRIPRFTHFPPHS